MYPKVSIIWVNFNCSGFIDIAKESLAAVKDLDYSNFELIIVDNASTDGSLSEIKSYLEKSKIRCRLISLKRNLGFTGGNNVAYFVRSRESKYIVLLNNDAIPTKESLTELVDIMENDITLGAAQGVILNFNCRSIDTAGDYLSELFEATSLFQNESIHSLKKPVYATSADAAYSIFRVKAINSVANLKGAIFDDYLFGYFDDHMLGLKLWNNFFKVRVFPIITAKHQRGSSFGRALPLQAYLYTRNLLIMNEICNSRYRNLIKLYSFRKLSELFFTHVLDLSTKQSREEMVTLSSKACVDGLRIGSAKNRSGDRIDLYKAPILEVPVSTAFLEAAVSVNIDGRHLQRELDKVVIH
jgi:GT2 family glycosyltransferase